MRSPRHHLDHRSRPGAFRLLALASILLALLGIGGTAASAQGTITEHLSYTYAMAEGTLCTDEGVCGYVSASVGPGKFGEGTILCLGVDGPEVSGSTCADVALTYSIDSQHLTWAELAPTPVTLVFQECDKEGNCAPPKYIDIVFSASWSAVGNRQPAQENLGNPHGPCTSIDIVNGFFQPANVSMTIDGQALNGSGNLQSINVTKVTRTNCG